MKLDQSEKEEVARLMATGEITPAEVAMARRTIHGAKTDSENPKGVLLMEDLTTHMVDDIECYHRIMRVHQLREGSIQFRFAGPPDKDGIPAILKVIRTIEERKKRAISQ